MLKRISAVCLGLSLLSMPLGAGYNVGRIAKTALGVSLSAFLSSMIANPTIPSLRDLAPTTIKNKMRRQGATQVAKTASWEALKLAGFTYLFLNVFSPFCNGFSRGVS